jgi:type I restriction enzyme, S subunit
MLMPIPTLEEQSGIASFIQRENDKIDRLIAESSRAIDLLQERRTALISAAVTGKVDVRGLVAEEVA